MTGGSQRRILFLQGPLAPLFAHIADRLAAAGHRVYRINLCLGDRLHWGTRRAVAYRGRLQDWPHFVDDFLIENRITDVIMHGDRRPYHRAAGARARARGVNVIATELGYLRPDWMTIERDGTNAGSHFPADPEHIRRIAGEVPPFDPRPRFKAEFWRVAVPDVVYNLANTLLWPLYPFYQRHTIYFPPLEYAQWVRRLAGARRRNERAEQAIDAAAMTGEPCFAHLLQLEGDFQIRDYSPFAGQAEAIEHVVRSFARHAASRSRLLVKAHPLDNGLHRWDRIVASAAGRNGVAKRVAFLDGGSLPRLVEISKAVVTINSSAGLDAMVAGRPTLALGPAIYRINGLTHMGPLDTLWTEPRPPDPELLAAFLAALAATVQVRGTIYSREGLEAAADGMAQRIMANSLNAPDAFVDPPPRLADAGREG